MRPDSRQNARPEAQFGLLSLFGFVTLCAVLSALSAVVGVAASAVLMLMALALWARQGLLALVMLMAALLVAGARFQATSESVAVARQVLVILTAAALCGWYCLRRRFVR
jgi:hypothetical protein